MNERARWDRATLKEYAKTALKPYYWWAVLASLIVAVLCSGFSNGASNSGITVTYEHNEIQTEFGGLFGMLAPFIGIAAVLMCAIAIVYSIFIANPLHVGLNRFYMENRFKGGNAPAGNLAALLHGFSGGNYMNVVKTLFFRDLYIALWSLLFIIPGIIKTYEYAMVPYILAENPDIPKERAFQLSKEMMMGRKWDAFVFGLSFLGWQILASMLIVGGVFLNPYVEAAHCEMYLWLRYDALYNNYAHPQELNGLFMNSGKYRE